MVFFVVVVVVVCCCFLFLFLGGGMVGGFRDFQTSNLTKLDHKSGRGGGGDMLSPFLCDYYISHQFL